MSIQKVLQYVGKVVFQRGQDYYKRGSLLSYNSTDGEIIANVKGTATQQFTVKIEWDDQQNISGSSCTCPLWDRCQHIAAVLIHHYGISPELEIEVPAAIRELPGHNETYQIDFSGSVDPWVKNIVKTLTDKYIRPVKEQDHKIWKLFFRLRQATQDTLPLEKWEISPVIRYVKKDGSLGGIYNYTPKKELIGVTPREEYLLNLLLEQENHRDAFIHYLNFFLQDPSLPLLLVVGYKYFPMSIRRVANLQICFKLVHIDKKAISFKSYLNLFYGESGTISTRDVAYNFLPYGSNSYFIFNNGLLLYTENNISLVNFLKDVLERIIQPPDVRYLQKFCNAQFAGLAEVYFTTSTVKIITGIPEPIIELNSDVIGNTNIRMIFKYDSKSCSAGNKKTLLIYETNAQETVALRRDFNAEKRILTFFEETIKTLTLINHYEKGSDYKIRIPIAAFIAEYGINLMDNGFTVSLGKNKKLAKNSGRLSLFVKTGIQWLDMELKYLDSDGKQHNITLNQEDLQAGLIKVDDRFILLKRTDIESIRNLQYEGINQEGRLQVSKLNFNLIEEFHTEIAAENQMEIHQFREIYTKLKNITSINSYPVSPALNCTLRNYQEEGMNWLYFLNEHQLNGCLADDMGLGKTVQTIALLQGLKDRGTLGSVLLVVPVTLVANWENELKTFAPDLTHVRHTGKNRMKQACELLESDIVIISYQTLRIDIEFFNKHEFNYIILDESQNIKNAFTQTYKAIKTVPSRHRLALTGTPVENNTLELWAQMEFLNPGLLRTISDFKQKFTIPIEEHGDKTAADRLRRVISPFILRRKKEDVIKELPEKEIVVCYSEMNLMQKDAYHAVRDQFRQEIQDIIHKRGLKRSKFEIFNAILRLRQMALFPELVSVHYGGIESCKFEMLKEMLEEILEENHKVLIFSQFVKVLQIIKNYLSSRRINYSYIDGSTQKRDDQIISFQEEPDRRVFLLSLKAGGTGINLTAADYVLLFDPWWNPAVENQAIDRTHRIGQTRKVLAYKMIVKDSIEEKILNLQNKKAELVNKIITEDKSVFKLLSEDDIIELFQ